MGHVGNANQLVGLRVVRGPNWEWDTQDGGEGCVGTVIGVVGNYQTRRNVKVRWDSGKKFVYRIGAEDAYDLRVLDNSIIGVEHVGVKCQGCEMEDIVGLRWQCLDCPKFISLCTFCFTNGKHDQSHVYFRRYDRPSSDPIRVTLDKKNIQLKGFFPGAHVGRGEDWKYDEEDGGFHSIGEVMPVPTQLIPGKVWVQWQDENKPLSYRVGFNGNVDLEMVKAGIGGHYQPHTLPVLKISKQRTGEKSNDEAVPLVVGDTVKFVVELEVLREMVVDGGLRWNGDEMKKTMSDVGTIEKIDKRDNTVKVKFKHSNIFCWLPEKSMCRLIPWLPVGAVVQVSNVSDTMKLPDDVMIGDFGYVERVHCDGENVDMEFVKPEGRVVNEILHVNQLKYKSVDMSMTKKEELIRKDLANLLVSEVEKGTTLSSVEWLLKNHPNIVNCRSSYNKINCTALSVACKTGDFEMVNLLLQHNASVHVHDVKKDEDDEDEDDEDIEYEYEEFEKHNAGNLPIHHAVLGNHPEILRLLLDKGASPNDINQYKETSLHLAAKNGHVECVRILLADQRCDPNLEEQYGRTALRLAVESPVQSLEMFNLFHATGNLKINEENYKKLLGLAVERNNFGAAKFLLSLPEGKELVKRILDRHGTLLHCACSDGHNEMAKLFLSSVKDENGKPLGIDRQGSRGRTPLMIAIKKCNYELIEILIKAGANLQAVDTVGKTAFYHAGENSRFRTFKNGINWPNGETSPEIFKIYNDLKTKHPDGNLHPSAAVVLYIIAKRGIPEDMTLPDIKRLIEDDFLYDEIIKICPDVHLNSQVETDQTSIPKRFVSLGDHIMSTTQQQPTPSSQQQPINLISNKVNQVLPIESMATNAMPSNSSKSCTQTADAVAVEELRNVGEEIDLFIELNDDLHSSIPLNNHWDHWTRANDESCASSAADILVDQPVTAGYNPPSQVVTCTIEEKTFIKRNEDGSSREEITHFILIDEYGGRYSQQKKTVTDIFQCTSNVKNQFSGGIKKCKGTIFVKDLKGTLEEWKNDPKRKFMFTVRNPHEEHSPKRGRLSVTSSEASSISIKKKKK